MPGAIGIRGPGPAPGACGKIGGRCGLGPCMTGLPAGLHRRDPISCPCPSSRSNVADEFGHLPRRPGRIFKAALWSMQGLRAAWLHESSFRLEVYLFVILAPLGWWLGESGVERALLIGSMLLVLSIELLNSAVEAVISRYGDEFHELSGRAKDMGSAAVFVLMMNVLLVWGLIVGPRLL